MPMFVIVADLMLIPSDEDGECDALCTKIRRPVDMVPEYLLSVFFMKKLSISPLFVPGSVVYFSGTEWPIELKPELNLKQLPKWKS